MVYRNFPESINLHLQKNIASIHCIQKCKEKCKVYGNHFAFLCRVFPHKIPLVLYFKASDLIQYKNGTKTENAKEDDKQAGAMT